MKIRRAITVGLGALAFVAAGAGAASAGEVTGTGASTQGPAHANSICVYSGLNDDLAEAPGRTQSYGQVVRAGLQADQPSPGVACNGHSGFLAGGFPEE